MIDKNYRANAIKTYGESCEICGHRTSLEVHHINYQEHQQLEDLLRYYKKYNLNSEFDKIIEESKLNGFDIFDKNQLSKDDSTTNLSVLCGNCHTLVHTLDIGMKVLKVLKSRQ